jgi:hypothetical protein
MGNVKLTSVLRSVVRACDYLNPASKGGAHTDVLAIDGRRLAQELAALGRVSPRDPFRARLEELAERLSRRFILKRGKIEDFRMQLVGSGENEIPRSLMSHAFGPVGYNLLPTVEKTLSGSSEAAREIPWFAFGERDEVLAPDVLARLAEVLRSRRVPRDVLAPEDDLFLCFLDEVEERHVRQSVYDLLTADPRFSARAGSWEELREFQHFVRANPLTREMEDRLAQFFSAPITVGVRDTIRWAMGSRHPEMGWDKARETIVSAFAAQGEESFLPVEVTYYAADVEKELAEAQAGNARVVELFAARLMEHLKTQGFVALEGESVRRLAAQVLDFHHGYPVYELEPYQGILSLSTLKMAARAGAALAMLVARIPFRERRNSALACLRARPGELSALMAAMDEGEQERLFRALGGGLAEYIRRGGAADSHGNAWEYRRIPRTFYSFQERADYKAGVKGKPVELITLEQLHQPEYRSLLATVPGLADKLTVFFTLVHRYYKDTGYVPDLRPKNAGRDIFLLGIWGYVSDNLLLSLYRDRKGTLQADLSFVDNRDQFKEYRREEDRRRPVGLAKNALRLTGSLIEPAMLRAIGLFTDHAYGLRTGRPLHSSPMVRKWTTGGLFIAQEVAHAAVEQAFDTAKTAAVDGIDDVFAGARKVFRVPER